MLPKKYRLKHKKDFEAVFKQSKEVQYNGFVLRVKFTQNPTSRFGIIISGKVVKRAVRRNKLRRQIYEIIRTLMPKLKGPIDVVFIVKSTPEKIDFITLQNIIKTLFRKLNLMIPKEI